MTTDKKEQPNAAKRGKGFDDLAVFQRAYRASLELHRICTSFPDEEKRSGGMSPQLRRATRSVCANIAEGYGAQSVLRRSRYLRRYLAIAAGSADEARVWLRYCADLGYIDKPTWEKYSNEYREIARMLVALSKTIQGSDDKQ